MYYIMNTHSKNLKFNFSLYYQQRMYEWNNVYIYLHYIAYIAYISIWCNANNAPYI